VDTAAAAPAYATQPAGGGGKVVLAIGIAALVVAAAVVGYKIFGGATEVKDSLAGFSPSPPASAPPSRPTESAAPPAPPRDAPKVDEAPLAAAARTETTATSIPKAENDKGRTSDGGDARPKAAAAPVPGSLAPTTKSDAKGGAKGNAAATPAPGASTAPASAAASPPARPAAAAPVAPPPAATASAPVLDRWTLMANEQRACRTENMFNRVVCDQRVRLRYCNGYWGTVPQCPGGVANPDKGQ